MTVSRSQARDALRLLLAMLAIDDEASPADLEAIRIAVQALDCRLGTANVTRAIETLGALAASCRASKNPGLVQSALMAGLDAVIAQALASGTGGQPRPQHPFRSTPPPSSSRSSSPR